jgi:hemoglobin
MKQIENRDDVSKLVHFFYAKIRKDLLLGPIFNKHIQEEQWPAHLIKLTDFWETNLFSVPKFKGNPTQKHVKVDSEMLHGIKQGHFDHWLKLWDETLYQLFEGELADKASNAAKSMAAVQFMMIVHHRPQE